MLVQCAASASTYARTSKRWLIALKLCPPGAAITLFETHIKHATVSLLTPATPYRKLYNPSRYGTATSTSSVGSAGSDWIHNTRPRFALSPTTLRPDSASSSGLPWGSWRVFCRVGGVVGGGGGVSRAVHQSV